MTLFRSLFYASLVAGTFLITPQHAWAQEAASDAAPAAPAPEAASDAAPAEEEAPAEPWTLSCELGANLSAGNSRTGALSTGCDAGKTFSKLVLSTRAEANYGRVKYSGPWIVNQENMMIEFREEYLVTEDKKSYLFATEGVARDEFAGYQVRIDLALGAGYSYILEPEHKHGVEAGATYRYDRLLVGSDNRPGAIITALGNSTLSDSAKFNYKVSFLPSFSDGDDWGINAKAGLSLKISDRMSFKTGLGVIYDNQPALIAPLDQNGVEIAGAAQVPAKETDIKWTNVLVVSIF